MISLQYYQDKTVEIANLSVPDRKIDPEKEPVFSVDLNSREITVPSAFRQLAVYGDHKAETIWFAFDRYFDGEDLMGKSVGLQYINALGQTGMLPANFVYEHKAEGKNPTILLGWQIGSELTSVVGSIEISIRFFKLTDTDLIYSLGTEPFTVQIAEGLFVTDESENLNPSKDSLSQLVARIEELYKNNEMAGIDYSTALNKPSLNDITLLGKLYTNIDKAKGATAAIEDNYLDHWIPVSYNDLLERPRINGHELTGNLTSKDLEISVDVDDVFSDISTNPVQNKVISVEINNINGDIDALSDTVRSIQEELEGMTYIPLSISDFYHTYGYAEKGSTVNEMTFEWTLSGNAVSLTLNDNNLDVVSNNTTLSNLGLKEDTEFTLLAIDRKGNEVTATTDLLFTYKVFYGAIDLPIEYDNEFINSLTGELQLTREKDFTVTASDLQYIYYAVPAEYGDCIFTSGGFTGGFTKVATIPYTNQYDVTVNYDIWKSDYSGLGNTNIIVS